MDTKIFEFNDLQVWDRGGRYFVRYDAGAHQVVVREDEISEAEAREAAKGKDEALKMLFALRKRLIQSRVDPYVPNIE
ncbi:MAG TPA: hypothetical protein VN039_07660 [Nitrospira sp.]|nr:hypothetical protein [Nitrospira sp.]